MASTSDSVRVVGLRRCSRSALLGGTALRAAALVVLAAPAARAQLSPSAHPMGGQVVGGSAAIQQKATATNITQTSGRAAIDWQSFNVGRQSQVNFSQPNSKSVVLNTVVGPNPSEIAGRITANGVVAVVNQSGVIFDKGSQVDTAGLIVSAAGITRQNFMAGHMVFDQAPHPGASVVNNGTITIRQAGLAALVAPQVVNNGLIQAKLGRVVLGGAATYTLDLYGDGLLALNVTGQVTQVTVGGRTIPALVTNAGTILADGGSVVLNASAADGLIRTLVEAGGTIAANSVGNQAGRVLVQGVGGSVDIAGAVSASGLAKNTSGGTVVANATGSVSVDAGAHVDASGQSGGGLIALGTTAARARSPYAAASMTAQSTNVAAGARISANAARRGHGGQVTLLSSGTTSLGGVITVLGGAVSGSGGSVEISGEQVPLTGLVDARAPHGRAGGLLIDPLGVVVADKKPDAAHLGTATYFSPATLQGQHANVTLTSSTGDIDFAYSGTTTANTLALGSFGLTVTTSQNINIDNGFSISAGAVQFGASTGVTFGANTGTSLGLVTAGSSAPSFLSGSTVSINAGSSNVDLAAATITAGTSLALNSTLGNITGSGVLTAPLLTSAAATGISLTGSNVIGSTGIVSTGAGDVAIADSGALTIGGAITTGLLGGNISIGTGGTLTIGAALMAGATHTVSLNASAGDIVETVGGGIVAGLLTGGAAAGSASLDVGNTIGAIGAFSVAHDLSFANGAAIHVTGNVHAGGVLSLAAGGLTHGLTVDAGDTVSAVGSIVLEADSFAISGSVSTTGLIALSRVTAGGYALTGALDSFGGGGLTGFSAGTIALGSLDGIQNNTLTTSVTLGENLGSSALTLGLFASGTVLQTGGNITAATVEGLAGSNIQLASAGNSIAGLGPLVSSGGSINIADNHQLTTTGSVSASNGLTIGVTGAGNQLTLANNVVGASVTLSAPGQVTQSAGTIEATSGNVSLTSQNAGVLFEGILQASSGLVSLNAGLSIADLSGASVQGRIVSTSLFGTAANGAIVIDNGTNGFGTVTGLTSNGNISLGDASGFVVNGSIAGGAVSLNSGGVISQTGGSLTATSLTGSAQAGVSFALAGNNVGTLNNFTSNGFTLVQATGLSVSGTVNAGSAATLSTGASALTIPGSIDATSVSLTAASVGETGSLTAGTLDGTITNGATLTGSNAVGTLGNFSAGSFVFKDGTGFALAGNLVATSASLASAGTISQASGGITATSLTGSAVSSVSLTSAANSITNLGSFTSTGGFALWDAPSVTVTGAVNTSGGALVLHAKTVDVTAAGTLTDIAGTISLAADTLTLAGNVTTGAHQGLVGITLIDAGTLTISAGGLPTVTTGTLAIGSLDGVTASGSVTGIVLDSAPTGPDTLAVFTSGTLTAVAGISVGTLSGSVGVADFAGTDTITTLRNFAVTGGGLTLHDANGLILAGSIDVAGATNLTAAGNLTERAGGNYSGALTATSLTGSASGLIDLGDASNSIGSVGNLTATAGPLTLTDAASLSVTGSVASGGDMTIAVTGASHGLSLVAGSVLAPVGNLALSAAGAIDQAAGASLSADTLTATGGGSVSLVGSNTVVTLGSSGAATSFVFDDGRALTVAANADVAAGSVTLSANGKLTQLAGSGAGLGTISATSGNISLTSITSGIAFGGTLAASQGVAFAALTSAVVENDGTVEGVISAGLMGGTARSFALAGANSVGTLSGLHATAGTLSFDDTPPAGTVTVTGVSGSGSVAIDLAGNGSVLDLTGALSGVAVELTAPGGISQSAGSITATTVAFSASHGAVSITGASNAVGTLLTSTASGNIAFSDSTGLAVTGVVTAGSAGTPASLALSAPALTVATGTLSAPDGTITLATDTLTLGGVVTTGAGTGLVGIDSFAGSVLTIGAGAFNGVSTGILALGSLNGTSASGHVVEIDINGALDLSSAAPTLGLFTTAAGTVTSATGIRAGTVIGHAGTVSLTGNNQISTLASFTAVGGFTLDQPGSLDVVGPVDGAANTSIVLSNAASVLTIAGSVTGATTHLGGATIDIPGTVTASTLLDLMGSNLVSETGTITAGTLTGDGAFSVGLSGTGAGAANSNKIGTLGNFTADGGFSLVDAEGLAITGSLVSAGTANLSIFGTLDGHAGSLQVGTLSGSATGSASLTGSNNIGTLNGFSADGLTLDDGGALSLAGVIDGAGSLSVTSAGSLSLLGNAALTGSVTALQGAGIDIALGGSVTAPTSLSLSTTLGGAITEEGSISTGSLTGSSGTGVTRLTGVGNAIKALGNFLSGAFSLSQTGSLSVAGTLNSAATTLSVGSLGISGAIVSSSDVDLVSGSFITETGAITAASLSGSAVGDAALTGTNRVGVLGNFTAGSIEFDDGISVAVNGSVLGTTSVMMTLTGTGAGAGTLTVAAPGRITGSAMVLNAADIDVLGVIDAAASLDLIASGSVNEPASGSITTSILSADVGGSLSLNGAANLIGSLGNITSPGGFTYSQLGSLTIAGTISGGSFATITSGDLLTVAATGSITSASTSLTGSAISIAGTVTGTPLVSLTATVGTIDEVAATGSVNAGTLVGSASGGATLLGVNSITTLGVFTAASLDLLDTGGLSVGGKQTITGGIALSAGSITVGAVIDASSATLTSAGTIAEVGAGSIDANSLTGSSTGNAVFGGANLIGTLSGFTAADFSLQDGEALDVTGALKAATISLAATKLQIDGAITATGAAGLLTLTAQGDATPGDGTIDEAATGSITAATLTGSAQGSASLVGVNSITTLGNFSAAPLTWDNATGLTIASGATVSGSYTPAGGKAVTGAVTLAIGGTLAIDGILDVTGENLDIAATQVTETGRVIAGSLTGTTTGSTSLTTTTNAISSVGSFTADGFSLVDAVTLLDVAGPLQGGTSVSISDLGTQPATGNLLVSGSVDATAVTLHADQSLSITGSIAAPATLAVSAGTGANTGTLSETGSIITGTLSGNVQGVADLGGNGFNSITTLGSFTATGGLTLIDNSALTIVGPIVSGPFLSISTTASLTIGDITGGTVAFGGSFITIDGTVDATSSLALRASGATAHGVFTPGTISEVAGGAILTPLFAASAAGDIDVSLPGVNKIAAIGTISAGGLQFADTEDLAITGPIVSSAGATLTDAGHGISVSGSITATDAALTAGDITVAGMIDGSSAISLVASAAGTAHGTILETGALITPSLTGSASGSASFLSATGANAIDNVSGFSAAGLSLNDSVALTTTGTVSGGNTLSLAAAMLTLAGIIEATGVTLDANAGTLSEMGSGAISATSLNGSASGAVVLGGANSLINLGSFTADGFTLNDKTGLTIGGPLAGGPSVNLTATALSIPGTITATVLALSIGGTLSETGSVDVTSLTGSVGAAADFTGSNSIATLGNFTAASLVLDDTASLQVAGTVVSPATTLVAANIDVPGLINATDLVLTSSGSISEAGTLLVSGTLSGSAAGSVTLTGAAFSNDVATLGSFTAAGLTLNDGAALRVAGPVDGMARVVIDDSAGLTVAGALNGDVTTLTAASFDVPGTITAATSLALSIGGTIAAPGSISTALLSGTAGGSASFSGSNSIANVGPFTAAGFTLNDTPDLVVVGAIDGGSSVTITDAGALTVASSIAGASTSLTAAAIDVPGSIAATTLALTSTSGGMTEAGSISAGTLTGAAATSASLTGANSIATLGDFTAANGFILNDASGLAVTGTLSGGPSVTIADASTLSVAGSIAGDTTTLSATSIDNAGSITAADALALTASAGGITSSGSISTALLSGSSTGTAAFTGSNRIAVLGNFIASGFALLRDSVALAVSGVVQAGNTAVISSDGSLGVGGSITGSTVALSGTSIGVTGAIVAPAELQVTATAGDFISTGSIKTALLDGSASGNSSITGVNAVGEIGALTSANFTLVNGIDLTIAGPLEGGASVIVSDSGALAVTGSVTGSVTSLSASSIDIPGSIVAPTSLAMTSAGGITETGSLVTPLLTIPSARGSVSLVGSNSIGALGNVSAAGFTLNNAPDLTVEGTVNGQSAVAIDEAGALTVAAGGGINGDNTSLNAGALNVSGQITAGTELTVGIVGSIAETGVITTGLLTGSAGVDAMLDGANQIAAVGDFRAGNSFALQDVTSLAFNGGLNAVGGSITAKAASITEAADASIVTGVQGQSATTGTITLGSPGTMMLAGLLDAPNILLGTSSAIPSLVTWDGNTIITGASEIPGSSKPAFPAITGMTPGIYVLAGNFRQTGSTVVNANGKSGTIEITLAHRTGSVLFDQGAGLVAPHSELFINLDLGFASGRIDVAGLNISYVEPGSNTPSNLFGTVDGEQGPAASGAAFIKVLPNSDYRLNSCPIQSVNCILVSPIIVPVTNPVDDVEVTSPRRRRDDDDLIIPNVGEQDF